MNRENHNNTDINKKEPVISDMNRKQHGGLDMNKEKRVDMNRELTSRQVSGYPGKKGDSPKNLKTPDICKDLETRLRSLRGNPGSQSDDRIDVENLEELRTRFIAEIGRFKWEYVYQDRMEQIIVLKNVRMQGSGKFFKSYLCLTCGEWARPFHVGDVIAFSARVKNGTLKYPTKATLIKSAKHLNSLPGVEVSTVQIEMS